MIEIINFEQAIQLDMPRRVRKYVLVWCASGQASIIVDEKEFGLKANSVITITSGQVHCLTNKANSKGYILEFTYDFFCKDDNDIELIFHNSLFCHFAMNEVIELAESCVVEKELKRIEAELKEKPYQYFVSVHSRIKLILVEINRAKIKQGDEIYKPDALFLKFLEAIRNNFEHNYPVSRFAELLGTTELKLNEHSKLHTGRTAQSVIYGLVASEAKRLLTYENLSVKEVAYRLGFNDPFYFSNFFKKHVSISPRLYQEKFAL